MRAADCYLPSGAAVKCWKCGSTNIKHVTVDVIAVLPNGDGPECEFKEDCGETLAYWAYGHYDPAFLCTSEIKQAGSTA